MGNAVSATVPQLEYGGRLEVSGVDVEKLVARDRSRRELILPEVGQYSVDRLRGDWRRLCGRAQESNQAFDVLGCGGQEELLLNELQPTQAETM